MSTVVAIATGIANLASVTAAFGRVGVALLASTDPELVRRAEAVVLPGVGDFAAGAAALARHGLDEPLRERLQRGRPTLAICLGMQLCLEASDEAPGCPGLGVVAGTATRFPPPTRCPQMGWNRIRTLGNGLLRDDHVWFANSYRLCTPPADWQCAIADHGGPFVAGLARDAQLLCQFHPELSGAGGHTLLHRWLQAACVPEAAC